MEQKNNFSENLNQIVLNITKMERKNKESDPKFQAWIEQICDPQSELNLVPNLLTFFLDEMTKQDEKEKILKLLVKLMMLQEESITEQLLSNKNFPKNSNGLSGLALSSSIGPFCTIVVIVFSK